MRPERLNSLINLLSSLWQGVKDTASSLGQSAKDSTYQLGQMGKSLYNNVTTAAKDLYGKVTNASQSASALDAYTRTGPYAGIPGVDPQTGQPNMSVAPNSNLKTNSGTPVVTNQYGQVDVVGTLNSSAKQAQQQALASYGVTGTAMPQAQNYTPVPRPSTAKKVAPAPVDSQGRVSTASMGNQRIQTETGWINPEVGFSGNTGSGGSSGGLFSLGPQTGTSGVIGGGSAFTGLLGGAGGLSTPAIGNISDPDEKKKQAGGISDIFKTALSGMAQSNPLIHGLSSLLGSGGNLLKLAGDKTPQITLPQNRMNVQMPTGTQDAGNMIQTQQASREAISKMPFATSDNDLGEMNAKIATGFQEAVTRMDTEFPIPENPVVDTQEQMEFIEQSQDPEGLKTALDQFRAEQTNLGALTTDRLNVMKQVQALNQTYAPILQDIKDNPNLPKALAMRRLEQVNKSQKEVLSGFLGQLEILEQAIGDQNRVVDRAFQIASKEEDKQERAKDNARQALQLMVTSGGIGGFTDNDIINYSKATGIPTSALSSMRTAANSPKTEIKGSVEEGYTQFTTDKNGKVTAKKLTTAAPKQTGGGVLGSLPVSIQNRVISIATGLDSNATIKKYNTLVDGINLVNGISPKSKNPAEHQQIIYAFAKSLDPESVVRESEYATISQYAQSFVDKFGKQITQAANGTGFLSEDAIRNIQASMNKSYTAVQPSYNALISEKGRVMDNIAGKPVSQELLVDYSKRVNTQVNNGSAPALSSLNFKF